MGSLLSVPAYADTFQPFVSASVNHDDNLFRLSDERLVRQAHSGADTYRILIGGMDFRRTFGRQLFSGTAKISPVKFQHNKQLDYTSKDVGAAWKWFLGEHVEGNIGSSYLEVLAPFEDFDSDRRNLRVVRKQYADGKWRFHPSWQWRGAYSKERYTYDLLSQRINNRSEESLTAGVDYLAASGSTVGVQLRRLTGDYPYRRGVSSGGFLDDGYVQEEAKVNISWLATGKTQAIFLGGWVQRKQNTRVDRNDRGTNARLIVNWSPVARVKLVGQAWREFAVIEGALVDSSLNTGSSAATTWDISDKIQAVINVRQETRKFNPANAAGLMQSNASLEDDTETAALGVLYKPLPSLALKLSAFRDRRAGSAAVGVRSYTANGAAINASGQF